LAHLEGVGESIVGHAWLSPGGLPELHFVLFRGFMIFVALLLLGLEVEVGGVGQDFLGFANSVVGSILIGPQSRCLLIHSNKLYEYQSIPKNHTITVTLSDCPSQMHYSFASQLST
jgi:hypothetical protein